MPTKLEVGSIIYKAKDQTIIRGKVTAIKGVMIFGSWGTEGTHRSRIYRTLGEAVAAEVWR